MEVIISDLQDLTFLAEKLLQTYPEYRIWALEGEMGAGKTTFVAALGKVLNLTNPVSSPTFPIIQEYGYVAADGSHMKLIHMDLYRLISSDEALDIGIEDYLYGKQQVVIEWPDLILHLLADPYLSLKFSLEPDGQRKVVISTQHPA